MPPSVILLALGFGGTGFHAETSLAPRFRLAMGWLSDNQSSVRYLHPARVAKAPSSLPTADLHANYVWEKFFNWQN